MEKIVDIFRRLGQKIKKNINRELLTYLVFLLIAIAVWYLNALSEEYTSELKFAVKYIELPEDKVLASAPPERLSMTMHAQGFTLLKYRFRQFFAPIELEAGYNILRKKNNSAQGEYYIATYSVLGRISAQLGGAVDLRYISPDTLFFVFTETIKKEIFVKPAIQIQFEKGFFPKGAMLIEPEKLTVTGPRTIVDTMKYVYTTPKVFKKMKDTLRTSINLQPVGQLRFSANEVNIEQAIQRYTEASITATIEAINVPENLIMRLFPGTITISCMVPVADYEKLKPHMFRVVVDYNSIKDATDGKTKAIVSIIRMPDYVTDVKGYPTNVDFIIEK